MYSFNGVDWNVLCSDLFSVWEWYKGEKMMIFSGGFALYLYMNSRNNRESEGCSPSHQQDLWTVRSDFLSIPKSSVKFLWVERTRRNVLLVTWRPPSQAGDHGGWTGVPNMFQTKCFQIRKVCWNSTKLLLSGKLSIKISWVICRFINSWITVSRHILLLRNNEKCF